MRFKHIHIAELDAFLASDLYLQSDYCPISRHRAISQRNNPQADREDVALVLAIKEEQIIGYIGLLPDRIGEEKVYWNSCWWASEEHRTVALPLLLEFLKVADKRILLTDMPPHTEQIIRKLKIAKIIDLPAGMVGYIGVKLANWLPERIPFMNYFKSLLLFMDCMFNTLLKVYYKLRIPKSKAAAIPINDYTYRDVGFISLHSSEELICRSPEDLMWIINNPWVLENDVAQYQYENYYFTAVAKKARFEFLRLQKNNKLIAILYVRVINDQLMTPYIYCDDKDMYEVARFLIHRMLEENCTNILVYNQALKKALLKQGRFLFKKEVARNFAWHPSLDHLMNGVFKLQDGDGDVAFC